MLVPSETPSSAGGSKAKLAQLPQWYTLLTSQGFKKAVHNHLAEQERQGRQAPWMREALSPKKSGGGPAVSPSKTALFTNVSGLVGDGTFDSEKLTASEATYRGLVPVSSYGGGNSSSDKRESPPTKWRPNSAALNSSYHQRPTSANANYSASSAAIESSYKASSDKALLGGRKFLHLDEKGSSKRLPIVLTSASPSFTANPRDVSRAASDFINQSRRSHSASGANQNHVNSTNATTSIATTNNSTSSSSPSPHSPSRLSRATAAHLGSIPVKKTQYVSGHRALLLQKAHVIAHVIANGRLYVSPVTGKTTAWGLGDDGRNYQTRPATAGLGAGASPNGALAGSNDHVLMLKGSAIHDESAAFHLSGRLKTSAEQHAQHLSEGGLPLAHNAKEVLAVMAQGAKSVTTNIAETTAEILLSNMLDDFNVAIKRRTFEVTPSADEGTARPALTNAVKTRTGDDGRLRITINSFMITKGSPARDALLSLARREVHAIDEAAAILEDGEMEHARKKTAREVTGEKLGLLESAKAVEDELMRVPLLIAGVTPEDGSQMKAKSKITILDAAASSPSAAVMLALRVGLSFGLANIGSENGLRDEIKAMIENTPSTPSGESHPPQQHHNTPHGSSRALTEATNFLWTALRYCNDDLNAHYLPLSLRTYVEAGETEAEKQAAEVHRRDTVSSAIVEALLLLTYSRVLGGGIPLLSGGGSDTVLPTTATAAAATDQGSVPVDGFGIPLGPQSTNAFMRPTTAAETMTFIATSNVQRQVESYAQPSFGFADRRHVFINTNRVLMALREVLGPLLALEGSEGERDGHHHSAPSSSSALGVEEVSPIRRAPSTPLKAPATTNGGGGGRTTLLESGTELIEDGFDEHNGDIHSADAVANHVPSSSAAQPLVVADAQPTSALSPSASLNHQLQRNNRNNRLALLILMLLSHITLEDITVTAAALMKPLWDWLTGNSNTNARSAAEQQQQREHLSHQNTPHIPGKGYMPPFIDLDVAATASVGGASSSAAGRLEGVSTVTAADTSSPNRPSTASRPSTSPSSLRQRPTSASSLSKLLGNGSHKGPVHRPASIVADEILARRQQAEERASPLPPVGASKRDPMTRVSKDAFNLERVLMSRLSRRMMNVALEDSDLGGGVMSDGEGGGNIILEDVHHHRSSSRPNNPDGPRPPTPTQPSNLTKLLGDIHARPVLPLASSPLNGGMQTASPNRIGLGGSLRNNAMPPFMTEANSNNSTTYSTVRSHAEPLKPSLSSDSTSSVPTVAESRFVQYLQKGIISEPYQKQLAHANPFVMTTLQRAAEVNTSVAQNDGNEVGGGDSSDSKKNKKTSLPDMAFAGEEGLQRDAKVLQTLLKEPSFSVQSPSKGYMHPTRHTSATRQQHFQQIQYYLQQEEAVEVEARRTDEGSAVAVGTSSDSPARPLSASAAAALHANSSIISGGSNAFASFHHRGASASRSPQRPRSGNFFSRTPSGFGASFAKEKRSPTRDGLIVTVKNFNQTAGDDAHHHHDGGDSRVVALGSNLGETPAEVQRCATPSGHEEGSHPLIHGRILASPSRPPTGIASRVAVAVSPLGVAVGQRSISPPTEPPITVTTGPPTTAPSIPSPARKRFGLPVRDVDRIVAARELAERAAQEMGAANESSAMTATHSHHHNTTSQQFHNTTFNTSAPRTQRAQPRVAMGVMNNDSGARRHPSSLAHRPVSAQNRDASGASPNAAIVLVPQLAALPVTSGGSFSQRLSAGFLSSPSGRHKRF